MPASSTKGRRDAALRRLPWAWSGLTVALFVVVLTALMIWHLRLERPPITAGRSGWNDATALVATPGSAATTTPDSGERQRVLLHETFASPLKSALRSGVEGETRYAFSADAYLIEVKAPRTVAWSLVPGQYGDVDVQVETTMIKGPAQTASALLFRYQNEQNFYLFNVALNGFYNLEVLKDGEWTTLIDWTPSSAIVAVGRTNTLHVELVGDRIILFINGVRLEEMRDRTFAGGQVALAVNTFDQGEAKVQFDNVLITAIP